jgi:hypothetical protein
VPGRKTDVKDAERASDLLAHGLTRAQLRARWPNPGDAHAYVHAQAVEP